MRQSFSNILSLILLAGISLAACGPEEDKPADTPLLADIKPELKPKDNTLRRRYYCNQITAQVQAQPKVINSCEIHGTGNRYPLKDKTGAIISVRNDAAVNFTGPAFKAIGMDGFSFKANQGGEKLPKFRSGVFVMDQVMLKNWPNNQASGSDATHKNSFFTHTSPDADHMRRELDPSLLSGYEIVSATLTVNYVEDIETEEIPGAIFGTQYARGNLSISLVPLGPKGDSFSGIFEFGTQVDWGIFKG